MLIRLLLLLVHRRLWRVLHLGNMLLLLLLHLLVSEVRRERLHRLVRRGLRVLSSGGGAIRIGRRSVLLRRTSRQSNSVENDERRTKQAAINFCPCERFPNSSSLTSGLN